MRSWSWNILKGEKNILLGISTAYSEKAAGQFYVAPEHSPHLSEF